LDRRHYNITKPTFPHQLQTRAIHHKIRTVTKANNNTQLKTLDVPSLDANGNPTWLTLTDPQSIETKLIERNIQHFGQASNTPITSGVNGLY
jgi:hypothetical protein